MKRAPAILCALALTSCAAFQGKPRPYAILGVASPARHNIEPRVGAEARWASGASIEAVYQPWFRVEDPSTRGFPEEIGRFSVETRVPIGGAP